MALTIGMRNPSSFDKEPGIQNPRLSWILLHGANNYHSDVGKKSNFWEKENV